MKITLTVALMLINLLGYSQTTLQKNTDLRFRGKVVGYPSEKDEVGLMKNFTLDIQWWMFLGEPMEFYGFEWTANDHFFIDGSKIARTQLIKYPDLLKRFDILKPSKMTLELVGGGEAKMGLNEVFVYRIPDYKVLYFKAGVSSENLSPDSPETWYQFWKWGDEATDINFQYKHIDAIYQNSENTFNNLTEEAKKAIIKTYKAKFKEASSIIITDLKAHLEWPTQELKSIAKLYKEYESGEKQASPLEEIEKAEKKIAKETTYTKDDFWGEVADIEDPELEIFFSGDLVGIRELKSHREILPPVYKSIQTFKNKIRSGLDDSYDNYFVVELYDSWDKYPASSYGKSQLQEGFHNVFTIFDKYGNAIIENFNGTYCGNNDEGEKHIYITRIKDIGDTGKRNQIYVTIYRDDYTMDFELESENNINEKNKEIWSYR